ncbi:MAG: glycosyl transferase family 1, partial [Patescibacteria group bacterium]
MANYSVIACLSTYPPRECGIATFSRDLMAAYNNLYLPRAEMRVVAMQAPDAKLRYPKNLLGIIEHNNPASYAKIAKKLNRDKRVKLVNIQHEFGIFGGVWGEYVEIFLKELNKPAV